MFNLSIEFAQGSAPPAGGISALGLNLKEFLFQLITFALVFLILRRYVFPKLVATLEGRRETLETSLVHAKQTEETLHQAEVKAGQLLREARTQADEALGEAQVKAREIIVGAEAAGSNQAARILSEAKQQLQQERRRLREGLKEELTELVLLTTEKVIAQKLDAPEDGKLIAKAVAEVAK